MPRKNALRENVAAVRSRLPQLSNLTREQIELALLHYESNIDETVEAFLRNGASEALNGWTETSNGRENNPSKRTTNKPRNRPNRPTVPASTSSVSMPASNAALRPSQRVSNIFQTFAHGGVPIIASSEKLTFSNTTASMPPHAEQLDQTLPSQPMSQNKQEMIINHEASPVTVPIPQESPSMAPTPVLNHEPTMTGDHQERKSGPSPRRKSIKNRHGSSSSQKNHQEKPPSSNSTTPLGNRKALTKSTKDLQRQTSTLANAELLFTNEIQSSIKCIDDIFKQIREIIKEREVELYLQMDHVKQQGLTLIHRRQQRAVELRQRMDRCDRLESSDVDVLRNDVKQFVTDRRYDLVEELTASHRFEFDQGMIEAMKSFGHVSSVDRKRSVSSSSALGESNANTSTVRNKSTSEIAPETVADTPTSNENHFDQHPALPQRLKNRASLDRIEQQSNVAIPSSPSLTNGDHAHTAEDTNPSNVNHYRSQPSSSASGPRGRSAQPYSNGNVRRNAPKPVNGHPNMYNNNSEPAPTYRRPRPRPPASAQTAISVQT